MNPSTIMEWDELNLLRASVPELLSAYRKAKDRGYVDRWCDYMDFVLCLIYGYGWKDAEEIVGIVPFKDGLDDKAVNLVIKGETFRDRVKANLENPPASGDPTEEILRIIDTEAHRDYNTGVYDAAKQSNVHGLKKQWWTMADGRVRETHDYIHGMVVGLDDRFYTFDGDSALHPGDFELPENNINCRCWITLAR